MSMHENTKLNIHLFIIIIITLSGAIWTIKSWNEAYILNNPMWFSRSGAILVIVAVFSNLLTRPYVKDISAPDLLNIYEHAKGEVQLKEKHWTEKVNLFRKLLWTELFLGMIGTLIWSYGDLLLN